MMTGTSKVVWRDHAIMNSGGPRRFSLGNALGVLYEVKVS
jgi:hypothetical protein